VKIDIGFHSTSYPVGSERGGKVAGTCSWRLAFIYCLLHMSSWSDAYLSKGYNFMTKCLVKCTGTEFQLSHYTELSWSDLIWVTLQQTVSHSIIHSFIQSVSQSVRPPWPRAPP